MDDIDPADLDKPSLEVVKHDDGSATVTLGGELDMSGADEVEAAVEPIIRSKPSRLIVDVSGMSFADSSAIALWVRWANLVDQVEIRGAPELLRTVIQRMGLADRLRLTP